MRDREQIPVEKLMPDPDQPRKHFDEGELLALGENMLAHGQMVPLIAYMAPGSKLYTLLDGERRWRAAQLVGIKQLDVIVLGERPTPLSLHVLQMSLEAHKVGLSLMERSNFLSIIKEENKWSVNELAASVNMKQPLVSKLLGFQKLCPEVRQLLHDGTLDIEKTQRLSLRRLCYPLRRAVRGRSQLDQSGLFSKVNNAKRTRQVIWHETEFRFELCPD
jgi:ParB family chromosome partitioning protein